MLRHHGAAAGNWIVENEVAARCVIRNEAVPFQKADDLTRLNGGWGYVGLILVLFHFAIPFVILLSRPFKRDIRKLVWLAVWLMLMRYDDLFWIIEPNFSTTLSFTWADVVVPIAIGGFWLAYFFHNLNALPLLPAYDPSINEVLEHAHE